MDRSCAEELAEPESEAIGNVEFPSAGAKPIQAGVGLIVGAGGNSAEDQLVRCRMERFEDEQIRQLEEDRLQEIIKLCQSYNDAQEGKRVRSLRVNEVDHLLELMKGSDVIQSTTAVEDSGGGERLDGGGETFNGSTSNRSSVNQNDLSYSEEPEYDHDHGDESNFGRQENEKSLNDNAYNHVGGSQEEINVKRESSEGDDGNNGSGGDKLAALSNEKTAIRGEIDDMKHQQFSDAEDEELKEFQRIEREIKLNELYKCLETIEKEISLIKQQQLTNQIELELHQHHSQPQKPQHQSFSPSDSSSPVPHHYLAPSSNLRTSKASSSDENAEGVVEGTSKEAPLASCESDEATSSDEDVSLGVKVRSADFSRLVHQYQQQQHLDNNYHTYSTIYGTSESGHYYNNDSSSLIDSSGGGRVNNSNNSPAPDESAMTAPVPAPRLRRGSPKSAGDSTGPKEKQQRPLTIYLPSTACDLDLIDHLTNFGHDVETFSHYVQLTPTSCSGYLWKLCSNTENQWRKRYFLFDRQNKVFVYFRSFKSFAKAKKAKYGVYFNQIEDAYVDHNRTKLERKGNPLSGSLRRRSNSTRHVFVVVTSERNFTLSAFVPEVMRIWIDVIFTGAEGYYLNYDET